MTVITGILTLILISFAVSLLLSPLETLRTAQFGEMPDEVEPEVPGAPETTDADVFVVFVSGIGSISGDALLESESRFLDRLDAALPEARIVRDMFPYAPSGRPLLTGQRIFSWFWRLVSRWRDSGEALLPAVLNIRNLFQVLVSADHRYGPLYSHSIAHVTADKLRAAGYPFGSGAPVILLGSSGGGQISVGAAEYLGQITRSPVSVVAFGGVMSADPGIAQAARLVSLYGGMDKVYALGRIVFPGRWRAAFNSPWNQAIAEHRLREQNIGPFGHAGSGGYLDPDASTTAESHLDVTVAEVARAIRSILPEQADAAGEAPD